MVPSQLWPKISTWVFKFLTQNSYLSPFNLFSQNFKTELDYLLKPLRNLKKSEKKSVFGQNWAFPTFSSLFLSFWQEFLRSVDRFDFKISFSSIQLSIQSEIDGQTWKILSVSLWSWSLSFKRQRKTLGPLFASSFQLDFKQESTLNKQIGTIFKKVYLNKTRSAPNEI